MTEESFASFAQAFINAHDGSLLQRIFIATVAVAHRVHDEPFDTPGHTQREALADKILQTGQDFAPVFANMICGSHAVTPDTTDTELVSLVSRHWDHVSGVPTFVPPAPSPPPALTPPVFALDFLASQNTEFVHRVTMALLLEANDVFNESTSTTGHVARLALANSILQGTATTVVQNFVNLLAAQGISDISTDTQIRQTVEADWNAVAGATPSTPVPTGAVGYAPVVATVATSESTTSTSYTNLATVGPTITLTVSSTGMLEIRLTARAQLNSDDAQAFMAVDISGANTIAATDARDLEISQGRDTAPFQGSAVYILSALNPGVTTLTAKYRSSGASATFANRSIIGIPL